MKRINTIASKWCSKAESRVRNNVPELTKNMENYPPLQITKQNTQNNGLADSWHSLKSLSERWAGGKDTQP